MTQSTPQQLLIRLPSELKDSIEKEASKNNRSMNAQVLFMLQSFEENNGRLLFLPNDIKMRIENYQNDNDIKSQSAAIRLLLNEALQNRDTIEDILDQLGKAFQKEKNLRNLARDILSTHRLITQILLNDDDIRFCYKYSAIGMINKKGELYINPEANGPSAIYDDNIWKYTPSYQQQPTNQETTSSSQTTLPPIDLDEEIPF